MALRGFIRNSDDRIRFVKSGYDADGAGTPPNAVIFDSADGGNLSLVTAGSVTLVGNTTGNNGAASAHTGIVAWSLPYVPLCTFQFSLAGGGFDAAMPVYSGGAQDGSGGIFPMPSILVAQTGIFLRAAWALPTNSVTLVVNYQAFRVGVS